MGQDQRDHDLLEAVTDYAIFLLDPQGRVLSWNAGAQRIKGQTPEETVGEPFGSLFPPEEVERGAPERALESARDRGRHEQEVRLVRKDSSSLWVDLIITPQHDDAGELIRFATVTRDVSEIRPARDQLALVSDRERIARELHAGTIRVLYTIGLHLQAIAARTETGVSSELQSCINDLDGAISELRRYVFGLDPASGSREERQG
jgi:PAS domain S-box-containing protein